MTTEAGFRCVVDANVALKLLINQPLSEAAEALVARQAVDPQARFYVPGFFYAECSSTLVQYVRQANFPPAEAKAALDNLVALALRAVPTKTLASAALAVALAARLNGYDAYYVALA